MSKMKPTELDVDFIGGQGSLTKEEEHAISQFIKTQKLLNAKKQTRSKRTTERIKFVA